MNRVMPVSASLPGPDQRIDHSETREGHRIEIEPDQLAIVALERVSGAHVHRAKGLIQAYTNACYLGELEIAEATKREMTALAVRCIRESLSRDAA